MKMFFDWLIESILKYILLMIGVILLVHIIAYLTDTPPL